MKNSNYFKRVLKELINNRHITLEIRDDLELSHNDMLELGFIQSFDTKCYYLKYKLAKLDADTPAEE